MDLFARPALPANRIMEIKECVVRILGLDEGAMVLVTELQCHEDGCPPLETVIAAFPAAGRRLQFKLHQPLADVTEQDIARVCQASLLENNRKKGMANAE